MGCTQASNVNRVSIAPMDNSEAMKQFGLSENETNKEGLVNTAPSTGDSPSAKIIRQDWAKLKQSLAPKNSIQLVNCFEAMKPLLKKAVGDDAELEHTILKLFQM